jgi:hypothetical protein
MKENNVTKEGLTFKEELKEKPNPGTSNQRVKSRTEKVSSDRGKFEIKQ